MACPETSPSAESSEKKNDKVIEHLSSNSTKNEVALLLAQPKWRRHTPAEKWNELGELRRTARELQISYPALRAALDQSQMRVLKDEEWRNMVNTDSRGNWTEAEVLEHVRGKRNARRIFSGLRRKDALPVPMVLLRRGQKPYLIAGNTRLMACRALGITPVVLFINL